MCSRPDREGAVTYSPTFAVPSAWRGLTSLFGMGRGGTPRCHHLSFSLFSCRRLSLRRPVWWRKRTSWKLIRDSDPIEASDCALRPSRGGVACGTFALSTGTCVREGIRAISIARLWALPPLHLQPIYVIVFDGPVWKSYLGEGFVLRCFQHLS